MNTRKYPYIHYKDTAGNLRKIVVIDQEVFYASTGQSSNTQGTWFPMLMLKGNMKLNDKEVEQLDLIGAIGKDDLKDIYNEDSNPEDSFAAGYLIKYQPFSIAEFDTRTGNLKKWKIADVNLIEDHLAKRLVDHLDVDRFARYSHMVTSASLSGGLSVASEDLKSVLTYLHCVSEIKDDQYQSACTSLIDLLEDTHMEMTDPDEVNCWLENQGAFFLKALNYSQLYKNFLEQQIPLTDSIQNSASAVDDEPQQDNDNSPKNFRLR
ncbi:MAG: hypothetical protein H0W64_10195 [Gammaproteobacteria bacterium]|nr:hypothetical protein [Gammaproteobacteria bacterium]